MITGDERNGNQNSFQILAHGPWPVAHGKCLTSVVIPLTERLCMGLRVCISYLVHTVKLVYGYTTGWDLKPRKLCLNFLVLNDIRETMPSLTDYFDNHNW